MATHAKKKFVVDPSEARYTGGHRRAFGSDLYEVEFFDGDRSGERIWVRQAPTAAQTRERMKRELADRRGLRKKVRSLEEAGPMCPPCAVDPDAVSGFPPRHRAQNSAMPETLADVVRRQAAEEEEHERRSLDPNDDYPPASMGAALDGLEAEIDAGVARQEAIDRQADQEFLQREVAMDILALAAEAPEDDDDDYPGRSLDPEDDDYPAGPVVVPRRMKELAKGRARRKPLEVGDVVRRLFRGREVTLRVVHCGLQVADPEVKSGRLGYEVDGAVYRSLTAAAESLTGYPVSGPVFWGLR